MNSSGLLRAICFVLFLFVILVATAVAKPIGGEPRSGECCQTCNQSTSDTPPGAGPCPAQAAEESCGCGFNLSAGKAGTRYPVFTASAANGTGLDLGLFYASYNADGEKAVIDTVAGYGWSHSYNIYLFEQGVDLFKMSPTGLTTKYERQGRRGTTYLATRGHQQRLVKNPDGSLDISNNDQLTFHFETIAGNPLRVAGVAPRMLTRITDRNGNETQLLYAGGRLQKVIGPWGRELVFAYNSKGQLISVTDPLGRVTAFAFNSLGDLVKITDPLGQVTAYRYNTRHQLTRKTDRNGNRWSFRYGAAGHPIRLRDHDGENLFVLGNDQNWATDLEQLFLDKQRVYVPATTTLKDGRGNSWNFDYDANGLNTRKVAPDGATILYNYDPLTLSLTSETDANGHTTSFEYDAKANLVKRTNHLGHETLFEYEPAYNMMTKMTDANGRVTTFEYDAFGNRIKETDPVGNMQSWTWDSHGNLLTETDKNGHTTTHEYDAFGNRIKSTDAEGNVTVMTYDVVGKLQSRTDANNHTTSFEYDALDRLIATTDPAGQESLIFYDPEGNRIAHVDRNGRVTGFTYDVRHRLVKITDALGGEESFSYDRNDNRVSMRDKNGHTTTFEFDVQNRLAKTTDAEGFVTRRTYDDVGNTLSQTDANGHTTVMIYDALDRLMQTTDAVGNITATQYDGTGLAGCPDCTGPTRGSSLITGKIDAEGKVTYFKYDGLDRTIRQIRKQSDVADLIDADDAVTAWTYDPVGNELSTTEPNGNTLTREFDDINREIKTTNAAGDVTLTGYDGVGNVTTMTFPNGNVVTHTYDVLDRLIRTEDSIGLVGSLTYDAEGNRLTERDGNNNGSGFEYDAIYRVTRVTDGLGEATVLVYDPVGNLLSVTDREGNLTTHEYDAINRRISTTDPLPAITRFDYDGVGNLMRITDANHHATDYVYDAINRLVREIYADGGEREFTYNGVHNLLTRTDQLGQTTRYFYTDLHFLSKRDYPLGPDDHFTYDLSGRMETAERGGWLVTFKYDGANRVIETGQNGKTVHYVYDIPGRTRTLTYPGGRSIVEATDPRARLDTVDDGAATMPVVDYEFDPGNRVVSRSYRNGILASYSYNDNDWVLMLEHLAGASLIAGFAHEHDREGNKLFENQLHEPSRSEAYAYDDRYRLTEFKVGTLVGATVPAPVTETSYDLDPVGNWNRKTTDAIAEIRSHSPTNEITLINAAPVLHDDNGNTEEDERFIYHYDEENRLTGVIRKADVEAVGVYRYDALGRRIEKIASPDAGTAGIRFYYDNARVIEERNFADVTEATYVYGNYIDEVLTMDRGGATFYFHQNSLWSVAAVTDAMGTVTEQYTYEPYGQVRVHDGLGNPVADNAWGTSHSAIANPYLYTGRRFDEETGLFYYRARFHDAGKGRFLQRDPLGYIDGVNLYQYAISQPTFFVDPTGTEAACPECCCLVIVLEYQGALATGDKHTAGNKEIKGSADALVASKKFKEECPVSLKITMSDAGSSQTGFDQLKTAIDNTSKNEECKKGIRRIIMMGHGNDQGMIFPVVDENGDYKNVNAGDIGFPEGVESPGAGNDRPSLQTSLTGGRKATLEQLDFLGCNTTAAAAAAAKEWKIKSRGVKGTVGFGTDTPPSGNIQTHEPPKPKPPEPKAPEKK